MPAARAPRRRVVHALGLLVGVLAVLAALAVPFAPVVGERVTVTWPMAGQPPESTVAFVVPYHPDQVHVRVPCEVVRAGQERGESTTLVSSRPPGQPTEGFAVTTAQDHVIALVAGREALRAPIDQACDVAIDGGPSGATARIGDRTGSVQEGMRDIVAFTTDLAPAEAAGTQVEVVTANWFETSPTQGKLLLITLQLVLVAAGFAVLAALDRKRRRDVERPVRRPLHRFLGYGVDLLLVAVLAGWWLLGPNSPDDSFASVTVQNALRTGDIGNYYRWENASEAPFTLVQQLLVPVAEWNQNPLAMRIPSIIAAVLTWLVLSRGVLGAAVPGQHLRPPVRVLAALAFLGWWLPFGMGVRPEAFEALGLTAVLAAALQAARTERRVWLGVAALAAGLSIAVNPMGITTIAPLLVLAPRLWRLAGVGVVAVLAGIASVGVVAMFADQSLFGAAKATDLHGYYGPNVSWFLEVMRWQYLLGFDLQGDVARRAAVLLTLVVAAFSLVVLLRTRREAGLRMAHVPAASLLLSMALMTLTPSKWSHYFGALAGVGAATLTAGAVVIGIAAATASRDRVVLVAGVVATALAGGAAALVFSGKNNWFLHSQYGVPWGEGPVRPLHNPLCWLLIAGLLMAGSALVRRHDDRVRRALIRTPALVCVTAMGVAVTIVLGSFVVAPIRQGDDAYSIGAQGIAAARGGSCGIADQIVVTPDLRALPGGDGAQMAGFTEGSGWAPDSTPPADVPVWGSLTGGQINTGTLATGWFPLPELAPDQELAFAVAGRSGDGNRVALEFSGPEGTREVVLDDTWMDSDERENYPTDHVIEDRPQDHPGFRDFHLSPAQVPPGAERVRITAADTTTDPAGWVAVSGPRLREVIPLTEYMRDRAPTYVDWSMTWNMPCMRDLPKVEDGLVEPPAYLITPPNSMGFGGTAAFERGIGGAFAGVRDVGVQEEIPTRLNGYEKTPEYSEWGHLFEVQYPYPGNRFDVQRVEATRWGWRGE
ncbi:indolylacetylinositol arabinosyltransferase [Saccharopolyspora rhizosphaerae]|uniref:Indolylacetylinositol arabinosyltransferase n=1 Tax=Saccharopolyspora rhizosphaerae TaxID=2492662 RepID=A0A3R8VD63_9PSEU|nr:arabinosyltransferase domain-containing protein [Saccharopolyspora rhizosphaerae]RRO15153.1 indolylacetylinositol arabinosyltransferase [Saccharopolyspora rhizosphaerae]